MRDELPPISTFLNRVLALEIALQNAFFEHFEGLLAAQIDSAVAAGTYEIGLETIRAESLAILGRQTIATHTASGAATMLYEIARKDRNHPLSLADIRAIADQNPDAKFLINTKSQRAALQTSAPSLTLDDGTTEHRVRLIRPMEHSTLPASALDDSYWQPAAFSAFASCWSRELGDIPEFTTSRFHIVTGLLLPVWKQLPFDNPRVYRFLTDDREHVIGRLIPPGSLAQFQPAATPQMTAKEAWAVLMKGGSLRLGEGLELKPATVMHARRIELVGYSTEAVPGLKALGLIAEIINWRLRLFIPNTDNGTHILAALIKRYRFRIESVCEPLHTAHC